MSTYKWLILNRSIWNHLTVRTQHNYFCANKLAVTHLKLRLPSNFWLIYMYHHHHHHLVVPSARISLTPSHHPPYRSSLPAGLQDYTPYLYRAAVCTFELVALAFDRPCEEFHKSTSLMSSSLLLQQYPACLVRPILIVFVMGGRWPYRCCFVGCCLQDLFNISRSIPV